MPRPSKISAFSGDRDVMAVAMDERFIIVGQADGTLSGLYTKNGVKVFDAKVSESEITAVCCEEQDEADNPIFYVGDSDGMVYTVNKKGKTLTDIQAREEAIHTISNFNKFSIFVYSNSGNTSFSHATTEFKKGNTTTSTANYSFDGDGTFHKKKGAGDYKVNQYNCRTPTRAIATVRLEFGPKLKEYNQVFAYCVIDEEYENTIHEGTAETEFPIYCSNNKLIRTLDFKSPVRQVMSCRHHEKFSEDKIYILLWNDKIYQVTGSRLQDAEISNDNLDLELIDDEDEEDEPGDVKGFCVYAGKLVSYGTDGLLKYMIDED